MYKAVKNLVGLTVCLTSVTAMAADKCNNYTGPYVGGNAGYSYGSGDLASTYTISKKTFTKDSDIKGFRGGVHGGYGKQFSNKTYLGIEAAADYSNAYFKGSNPSPNTFQSKRRDTYGLALRLGGVLGNKVLTYAKLGVENANWKTTGQYSVMNGKFPDVSQDKRATGAVVGIGTEALVTKNIMVGGECSYSIYNNASDVQTIDPLLTSVRRIDNFKARTADFRLRISYKW